MGYMGGKKRQARHIAAELNKHVKGTGFYLEPFCGMCSVAYKVQHKRMILSDAHPYLIAMWQAVMEGWVPPEEVSEEEYKWIRDHKDDNPALSGFVGFGCSFAGRWFAAFGRDKRTDRPFSGGTRTWVLKAAEYFRGRAEFRLLDYRRIRPGNALIYADPPYEGVTNHKGVPKMYFKEFWTLMEQWSENNQVFVSSFEIPAGWEAVVEMNSPTIANRKAEKAARSQPEYLLRKL